MPHWLAALPSLEKLDLRWNDVRGGEDTVAALRARGCVVLR